MFKLLFLPVLLVLLIIITQVQGEYVRIGNVRESWRTWAAEIDTLSIEIIEQDLMCRVWKEITFRDPAPSISQPDDSLELQMSFRLPENSAVDSLYLWIEGEPVPGLLMSASSARAIYESIVKRRKDPALLTTYGGDTYMLRIFPLMPGQSRKVRIGFHCTMDARSSDISLRLPMGYISTCSSGVAADFQLQVTVSGSHPLPPALNTPPIGLNQTQQNNQIYRADARDLPFKDNHMEIAWGDWPAKSTIASCYSTDQYNMGYFALLLDPFSLLGMKERPPVNLSVAWTPPLVDYSTRYFEDERTALKDLLCNLLDMNDKFGVSYAGSTLVNFSDKIVPATEQNRSDMAAFLDACEPVHYHYTYEYYYDSSGVRRYRPTNLPSGRDWYGALINAFESFTSMSMPSVVLVLDRGYNYNYYESRPTLAMLDSTASWIGLKNRFGAVMYVICSYSRLALYKKLVAQSGGQVIQSWASDDVAQRLGSITPDIFSVPLNSLTIQVSSAGGGPCLDVIGVPDTRIPWNNRILLSGRTLPTSMLSISIAGESKGSYVSATKSVNVSPASTSSPEKIWAARKVNLTPYYYYGYYGSNADELAEFSIKHGVLTRYSALLALEPGMDTAFAGSEQNSGSWGIRSVTEDAVAMDVSSSPGGNSEFPDIGEVKTAVKQKVTSLSVSPNPFKKFTRIQLTLAEKTESPVKICVYDISGRRIYTLKNRILENGRYVFYWNGLDSRGKRMAQGVYFLRIEIGSKIMMRKLVLM
jgi:hypothetical protein